MAPNWRLFLWVWEQSRMPTLSISSDIILAGLAWAIGQGKETRSIHLRKEEVNDLCPQMTDSSMESTEYSTKCKWSQVEPPRTKSRPKFQLPFYVPTTSHLQGKLIKQSHFHSRKRRKLRTGCNPGRERLTHWQIPVQEELLTRSVKGDTGKQTSAISGREESILLKCPHYTKLFLD